jgi:hypothetical protein
MEHLFNCHGEWTALCVVLPNIPIFGSLFLGWLKYGHSPTKNPTIRQGYYGGIEDGNLSSD